MSDEKGDFGILARSPGGPEVLEWTPFDTPSAGHGEVRIEQRAIGVNFIDTYFRKGVYPWPTTPLIPGGEAAGVVEQVGSGVTDFRVGDRVAYILRSGAYRTKRVVAAESLVHLPTGIDFEVAASVMLKGLTAQFLLKSCYPVKAGDTVLVHAAAGGVGLLLGQWLRTLGVTAIGTAGSADKLQLARQNGYAHVINYRSEDFAARVLEITGGKKCEAVYDSVAHDTWRGSLQCLKTRGTFVCFGQSSGAITEFKLSDLAAGGSLYACRPSLFDYIKNREELLSRAEDLFSELAFGRITSHIGQRFALKDAAKAHRELEARSTFGATVLLP